MNFALKIAIAALLVSYVVAEVDEDGKEDGVWVLNKDNFDQTIASNDFVLVEFYAPWCGHCKKLAPEYAKAAKELAEKKSPILLANVDATQESELASKYGVKGYPTLKFFKNGKPTEYTGGRTADTIVAWTEKKSGPPAISLADPEASKKFIEDNKVAVIGFFKNKESAEAKAFLEAADSLEDAKFGITSEDEVFKAHEVDGDKLVLFKQFDEGRNDFDGKYEAAEITTFVQTNSLPILVEFNGETANKIFGGDIKRHLVLFLSSTSEDFKTQSELATKVAKEHKGKILFVYIDVSKADSKRVLDFFAVKESEAPAMRMTQLGENMLKYKPEVSNLDDNDEFEANIRAFVDGVNAGTIKPHLKSEDVPEDWDKEGVKVLVGKNFADVAMDKEKHVLVEFYAPWCGHCKKLIPVYDELGEKYKDSKDIVIAKMDSTANEVEGVSIRGFPTIKLFKKGDNEVVDYDGARDLDGFVKFLEKLDETKEDEAAKKDEL